MKSSGPSGLGAVALTLAIVAALALVYASQGKLTCDPPRHIVDAGNGHSECAETMTLPDGRTAIVQPTPSTPPPAAAIRR